MPLLEWSFQWFDEEGFLTNDGFEHFETVLEGARAIQPEFKCTDEAFDFIAAHRETSGRKQHFAEKFPKCADSINFDNLLKTNLFPYQKRGVWFAATAGRCLLADEMGLGKTLQAIGGALLLKQEQGIQRVLIVCPTSLKYQWQSEIEKFSGESVHVVEGAQAKRLQQYAGTSSFFVIISYNTATNDADYLQMLGADLLILDEAQRIKNFRTKVSSQLKKVRTPYCFVLTGTPLENKLEDLYALTQFVNQYKLPPLYRFLDRYQILGENGQVKGYKNLKEIAIIMADCMIRRTKKEVLQDLPKRLDKVLFVPMTPQQLELHREFADTVARLVAKWRNHHFLSEADRRRLILSLSQMRMVADSTYILDQQSRFDTKINELMYIFEEALTNPEQKVVVFSQWERMTRLVAQELEAADTGFAYLHGGVPSADRADLMRRFQQDPDCRVFLSTDAGGVGLNLQTASMLVNLDIPWNLAVLEQRISRIHRMGQKENITVINMVSAETIEHRMLSVLEFKASMAQGVLDPDGDDTIFMSESKFKKFMENVEALTGQGLESMVLKAEAAEVETDESENYEQAAKSTVSEPDTAPDSYSGDDDVPVNAAPSATTERDHAPQKTGHSPSPAPQTPQDLVKTGISFFTGLSQTLSDPVKTQELVQSIVATDETTGQTYLRIPVESAAVVENAMKLLGGLLGGLGK